MIKIEKNIPMPKKNNTTEVMRGMSVGDSFVIPFGVHRGVYQIAINAGIKIKTKKLSNDEVRVWRIK